MVAPLVDPTIDAPLLLVIAHVIDGLLQTFVIVAVCVFVEDGQTGELPLIVILSHEGGAGEAFA